MKTLEEIKFQIFIDKLLKSMEEKGFNLTCPNCQRCVPNKTFFCKKGCLWCIPPKER